MLCIKVSMRDGCWQPDAAGGGYGCEPDEGGDWSVGIFHSVAAHRTVSGPAFHRDPPPHVAVPQLRVRHAADPRIAARNLTAGTLEFGAPDTIKAIGAFELLLCAAALAAPAVIWFLRRMGVDACDDGTGPDPIFTRISTSEVCTPRA